MDRKRSQVRTGGRRKELNLKALHPLKRPLINASQASSTCPISPGPPVHPPSTYKSSSFLQAPPTLLPLSPLSPNTWDPPPLKCSLLWGRGSEDSGMPCVSLSLCCPTAGTSSVGYVGSADHRRQIGNLDSTMGERLVSLSWYLQGSYLGALGTPPWTPPFVVAGEALHSPALMATSHRMTMKRSWRSL